MTEEIQQVRLFKQTYGEARKYLDGEQLPSLKLEGLVSAGASTTGSSASFILTSLVIELNQKVMEQARAIGAEYIFGIEYQIAGLGAGTGADNRTSVIVSGDAYSKKTKE